MLDSGFGRGLNAALPKVHLVDPNWQVCGRTIRRFKTPGIPPINAPKVPVEPKVASGSGEQAAHAARVNADPLRVDSNFLEEHEWLVYLGGIISARAVARSAHLSLAPSILKVLPSQAHT